MFKRVPRRLQADELHIEPQLAPSFRVPEYVRMVRAGPSRSVNHHHPPGPLHAALTIDTPKPYGFIGSTSDNPADGQRESSPLLRFKRQVQAGYLMLR